MTHFRDIGFCYIFPKSIESFGLSRLLTWLELNSNFVTSVVDSSYNICSLCLASAELVGVFPLHA